MKFTHPIYPVTNTVLSGLSHTEQVIEIANTGVDVIQLREKGSNPRDFFEDAKSALRIGREAGIKIIINDRVDIALALGADGVHLGQDDLSPVAARKLLGSDAIIGFSTHTADQAAEAAGYPIDYIAIGPVFQTRTKESPEPVAGVEVLAEISSRKFGIPVVAIGGIGFENIHSVANSGVGAAAVISSIYSSPEGIGNAIKRLHKNWINKNV